MPEDFLSQRNAPRRAESRAIGWAALLLIALAGIAVGGGAVAWLVLHGELPGSLHVDSERGPAAAPAIALAPPAPGSSESGLETRLAAAEQRLDRLDLQAAAAAGNAARAEGLLVAFAARRVIERGAQLGYLEDQLKLRFGDAQPRAVATLIAAAHQPVTLDLLMARLQMMAPRLTSAPQSESFWARSRRELSDMFTVRRNADSGPGPGARLDHALACLREGSVDCAIADVRQLPDPGGAAAWIADAQRYADAERALDLIETTALLEPHALGDAAGRKVNQPSPLAPPALAAPTP